MTGTRDRMLVRRRGLLTVAMALLMGLVPYVLVLLTRDVLFTGDLQEGVRDTFQSLEADRPTSDIDYPGIVFLDITDADYRDLGWPVTTPRAAVGQMLKSAVSSGASLVIVDIDIGWPADREDDGFLFEGMQAAIEQGVPVLFVRKPVPDPSVGLRLRPTPYDAFVAGSPLLHWVSAQLRVSGDGVLRRIRHWRDVCADQAPYRLPGVHLMANAALARGDAARGFIEVKEALGRPGVEACQAIAENDGDQRASLPTPGGELTLANSDSGSLIEYWMSWQANQRPSTSWEHDGQRVSAPVIWTLPAGALLEGEAVAPDALDGRLAIIGTSSEFMDDRHMTPLGMMPGAFVIANALRSFATPAPPPWVDTLKFGTLMCALSLVTAVLVWLLAWVGRRLPLGPLVGGPAYKSMITMIVSLFWFVGGYTFVGDASVIYVVFPQVFVSAYLMFFEAADRARQ